MKMFNHLEKVGESYWQHMGYALWVAIRLQIISLVVCIHAFLPCCFETLGSKAIELLNNQLRDRHQSKKFFISLQMKTDERWLKQEGEFDNYWAAMKKVNSLRDSEKYVRYMIEDSNGIIFYV